MIRTWIGLHKTFRRGVETLINRRITAYTCDNLPFRWSSGLQMPYQIVQESLTTEFQNNEHYYKKLLSNKQPAYKAVVFDKDGTLISFDLMWVPYAKHLASSISNIFNLNFYDDILRILGVCSHSYKVLPGLLAEGTSEQIFTTLVKFLESKGISSRVTHNVVERCMNDWTVLSEHVCQLCNLEQLLTNLRQHAVKIGLCTSDSRKGTIKALDAMKILHLFDVIICGDDAEGLPKPNPRNAEIICQRLGVKIEETVMVGDTPTDVIFAKNANFGLGIGVLSGIGQRSDLEAAWYGQSRHKTGVIDNKRFHIVPSVGDIIPFVLPDHPTRIVSGVSENSEKMFSSYSEWSHKYKLLIVDKDGSLANIYPRWSKWAEEVTSRLKQLTSLELTKTFLKILGYSTSTRRICGGVMVDCSMIYIKECLRYLLILNGYGLKKSEEILEKVWLCSHNITADPIPSVIRTLKKLSKSGMHIAINSSDSLESCREFLSKADLHTYVDIIVSAEDASLHPKPLPHTVLEIVNKIGCQCNETIVVGDCPRDLISGRAAEVGLTIGVLSGFSQAHNLSPYADILLPNLTYLPYAFTNHSLIDAET